MEEKSNRTHVLLLDIDGVMNSTSSVLRHRSGEVFCGESVIALRWLMARTAARVVVTSTRRRMGLSAMRTLFRRNKLEGVANQMLGLTPILTDADTDDWREEEIGLWLDAHASETKSVTILDDKPLAGSLARRQVLIDPDVGFTLKQARHAARMMEGKDFPEFFGAPANVPAIGRYDEQHTNS